MEGNAGALDEIDLDLAGAPSFLRLRLGRLPQHTPGGNPELCLAGRRSRQPAGGAGRRAGHGQRTPWPW